jgi:adenosylcobinamide-GDP ribazoletransferase
VSAAAEAWRAFLIAGRFLTRLPLPDPGLPTPAVSGRGALFYPLVGLLVGVLLAAAAALLAGAPVLPAAALLLGLWVWLTGALHLDGLADCADAWVGGLGSRERTFAILKDPTSGAMAVVALVLVLLAKLSALTVLVGQGAWAALLWLPALARAQLLALPLTTPPARPEGMGAALREHLPRRGAWLVLALSWLAALLTLAPAMGPAALVLPVIAAAVLWSWRRAMVQRLGGFTGDTAGALVELTEAALLLGLALLPIAG